MPGDPLAGMFWLLGDEDGNVSLMCRTCDTGGAPAILYSDRSPSPDEVLADAMRHKLDRHPVPAQRQN